MHEFYKKFFCCLIIYLKYTAWNNGLEQEKYSFMSCMVVHAFKSSTWKAVVRDPHETEASLIYRVSTETVRDT